MRTLDPNLQAATEQTFTDPIWLVELDLGGSIIRASSREEITWNALTWQEQGLAVHQVTNDALEVSLDNSDLSISLLALANDIQGNDMKAWLHYGGYAELRFTGVMDAWDTDPNNYRVLFQGSSTAAKQGRFPPDVISEGIWNHLPPVGTVIMAGDQPITLESE